MKPLSLILLLALTFTNQSVGAEPAEKLFFKDSRGVERVLEIAQVRQAKVKVESYGVIAYGTAKLRIASSRGLSAAQSEAETIAASFAANALLKKRGQKVKDGVSVKLTDGRAIYSSVHDGYVEVIWIYSP